MRLIDADALLAEMKEDGWCEDYLGREEAQGIYNYIEEAPTAYDVDKVLEYLEKCVYRIDDSASLCMRDVMNEEDVLEVVRGGGATCS